MAKNAVFSPDAARRLVEAAKRGRRLRQKRRTGTIGSGRARGGGGVESFAAKLSGATQDGSNKRWTYDWDELSDSKTAGYGGFSVLSGGRNSADDGAARNYIEDMNGASGLYGDGVNSDNLSGTFDIQPAPSGAIVRMYSHNAGGSTEYWFSFENTIDGSCA